jgi:hypothetical protein
MRKVLMEDMIAANMPPVSVMPAQEDKIADMIQFLKGLG